MKSSFTDLINKRRSHRKYTEQHLTPEEVETILKAGLMAPSSKSKNPWNFIVIENKETLLQLAKCKPHGSKPLENCVIAIVVIADALVSDAWIEDASIASIMMQLQAEDLGLGSCWIQIRNRLTENEEDSGSYVKNILDIPMPFEVLSIITIGHKLQERPSIDSDSLQWEKIHIEKF